MAKNDFDIDFDFEKEYGFDPNAVLDSDFSDDDLDLSKYDEELSFDLEGESAQEDFSDFDLDGLDLGEEEPAAAQDDFDFSGDFDLDSGVDEELDLDFDFEEAEDLEEESEEAYEDEEDDFDDFDDEELDEGDDLLDFSRRANFFGVAEDVPQPKQPVEPEEDPEPEEVPQQEEPETVIPRRMRSLDDVDEDDDEDDDFDDEDDEQKAPRNPRRRAPQEKVKKERKPIKLTMPSFLIKLYKLYFPSMEEINPKPDPNDPKARRRRKSKAQIFKEAYLPAILAGVTLVLILSFCIGSVGDLIQNFKDEQAAKELEAQQQEQQASQQELEAQRILENARIMAQGYDYQGAIDLLNSFSGGIENNQEMSTLKAEYLGAKNTLVEHKDPSIIPNLSFHVLIADPVRAFADSELGGQYNRNFVTIEEFERILDQLYKNNYVLVDYNSFVTSNTSVSGEDSYYMDPILLPDGKKPIMITETMVNYFSYMVDSNDDGEPDAGGDGFASKLVVDAAGDIKTSYVDINGQTQVGNYDLVPILEDFIKTHPDFSYRGARATLAVCGYDGVFGYRVNSSFVPTRGQAYVDQEIADAKRIVQTLKDKGYTIACYTYDNIDYNDKSATQIQADIQSWNSQIAPVVGDVNIIVFARSSDIGDYSGTKFDQLYNQGFRIFVKNADAPYAEINNTYVRQSRIMVTGNAMGWKSNSLISYFDPNVVLDMTNRKNIPN